MWLTVICVSIWLFKWVLYCSFVSVWEITIIWEEINVWIIELIKGTTNMVSPLHIQSWIIKKPFLHKIWNQLKLKLCQKQWKEQFGRVLITENQLLKLTEIKKEAVEYVQNNSLNPPQDPNSSKYTGSRDILHYWI